MTKPGSNATPAVPKATPGQNPDRTKIREIKRHFLLCNHERLARTFDLLTPKQQEYLSLLPLLFHSNHPLFPGYVSNDTPAGISDYTPDRKTLKLARQMAKSFDIRRHPVRQRPIYGIYLMGSSGTIAYTQGSDLDIWICHQPGLKAAAVKELGKKGKLISRWAEEVELEVHFFLMVDEEFRGGRISNLSSESSGTAQKQLLLDEFYRTGLLLAGRYPIWWLVPPDQEQDYERFVEILHHKRFIKEHECLDFGPVASVAPGEFLGAALWQLYKAIGSPHKSLLKILVLECYATSFPDPDLLSVRYKKAIYGGAKKLDELDPYVLMLELIAEHLDADEDAERLKLAQRSFYFKAEIPLSRRATPGERNWRHKLLQRLTKRWGWDKAQFNLMDARKHWKIAQVLDERQHLIRALTHSYKLLTRVADKTADKSTVSDHDMTILGRKLFAVFEPKAGKIDIINQGISQDLTEAHLQLKCDGPQQNETSWSLYRGLSAADGNVLGASLKRSHSLLELVAWCQFNGLLNARTRLNLEPGENQPSSREIEQLCADLRRHFPISRAGQASVEDLEQPPRLLHGVLLINLGVDPMEHYTRQGVSLTSNKIDALNYGNHEENLVQTMDYLHLNSWGELMNFRYNGLDGLMECLCKYLRSLGIASKPLESPVFCLCYTPGYAESISYRLRDLLASLTRWYQKPARRARRRYVLRAHGKYHSFLAAAGSVHHEFSGSAAELRTTLKNASQKFTTTTFDPNSSGPGPLAEIFKANKKDVVQCFYLRQGEEAHLYVLDEFGTLFQDRVHFFTEAALQHHFQRFFKAIDQRQSEANKPLRTAYYRLRKKGISNTYSVQTRPVPEEPDTPALLHIQVIAQIINGKTEFTLYCNGKEFSTLEYGQEVFQQVATYVLEHRRGRGKYPIYITDIDLSALHMEDSETGGLQTIHYLRYKRRIEQHLNDTLAHFEES